MTDPVTAPTPDLDAVYGVTVCDYRNTLGPITRSRKWPRWRCVLSDAWFWIQFAGLAGLSGACFAYAAYSVIRLAVRP